MEEEVTELKMAHKGAKGVPGGQAVCAKTRESGVD